MSPSKGEVKAMPDGMSAVTPPHLICANASAAIDFYKKAFGALEESRLLGADGKIMRASIRIGGALVFLVDEMPQWGALGPLALKGSPVTVHLQVEDVDTTFAQAVTAGAKAMTPVATCFGATVTASSKTRSATAGRSPRTRWT